MYQLQDETRSQAIERWRKDGGEESEFVRVVPMETTDGIVPLSHCNICGANAQENVGTRHMHYCPFAMTGPLKYDITELLTGTLSTGSAWDGWALEDIYAHRTSQGDSPNCAADLVDSILINRIAARRVLRGGPVNGDALALVDRPISSIAFKNSPREVQQRAAAAMRDNLDAAQDAVEIEEPGGFAF